jgi:Uma2 family endonuclease
MSLTPNIGITAERFHYYDRHPTAEDLMGESAAQDQAIAYLAQVLSWLLQKTPVYIARNLNIYSQRKERQHPLAPDLAVFAVALKPLAQRRMRSWRLYEPERPPPRFVLEVASESTWRTDLQDKPASYAAIGVTEYCLYDPNEPRYLPERALFLWRRSRQQLVPVVPARDGRLWSQTLQSWLVPDGGLLRLTDRDGVRRLTMGEAERAAKERAEAAQAEERAAKERAWAKLRELGIDPAEI